MITLADYWMGRDAEYPMAMTPQIAKDAALTVDLANKLLVLANIAGVRASLNPRTRTVVSSGWRPATVNAATPGAAPNSKHMTGQAIDLYDPEGEVDEWLMTPDGQRALEDIGLWLEHPSATKGWAHVQTIPPRSRNRVFYP